MTTDQETRRAASRRPSAVRRHQPCLECRLDAWMAVQLADGAHWLCVECGQMEPVADGPGR